MRHFRIILALSLLLALLVPMRAWAHAQLLSADPADNAVLESAPQAVQLQFNEPVSPLAISLIGSDGGKSDLLAGTTGGESVAVTLPAGLPQGTHVLSWRVVSTDGHPIGGSLVFSVGTITGAAAAEVSDPAVGVILWASKAVLFIALFAGIGGAVFGSVASLPLGAEKASIGLVIIGLPAAVLSLWLQGLDALGLPLLSANARILDTGFATSYGATVLAIGIGFLLALVALCLKRGKVAAVFAWLALITGALALALSGHAGAASPQWLTRPAVFLHIAGIIFWAGALLPLFLLLRERSAAADQALAQFSRFVPFAVAPIVLSGVTLAVIQMGWPGPHWLAPYGLILGAKLCLLAVLFGLALWNRLWLTRPALAGDASARQRLRQSIVLEVLLILVILGLVAGWRFTPPPRALATVEAGIPAEPLMLHLMDATTMAMVSLAPGQAGPVGLDIWLTDLEGMPISPLDVAVTLSAPALGIEPFTRVATEQDGLWSVEGLTIPVAGIWRIELDIRASRFELIKLADELTVP
ncbi:Copper transport protein YcnJ precursor [Devosia sp. LC5]|uniref:copper resistance CopC/CopD family protein n=1 Tax=Devosia sp. LC5 TaxID=1502724 RepID=UPI0004E2EB8A|nr:copper resistance protein CopC [Devosia sp. LC5]KFC61264.1 Copper transport protein YcnJ precursor [Devosia sp. LC5]